VTKCIIAAVYAREDYYKSCLICASNSTNISVNVDGLSINQSVIYFWKIQHTDTHSTYTVTICAEYQCIVVTELY